MIAAPAVHKSRRRRIPEIETTASDSAMDQQNNIAAFVRDSREADRAEHADVQGPGRQLDLHLPRISGNPVQIETGAQ
jgi:hypothetical protein